MEAAAIEIEAPAPKWECIYIDAFPRVYRALVATGARPEEAADAVHDAFAKALATPPETLRNPAGWLFVVAVRAWRRRRVRDRLLAPFALLRAISPAPSSDRIALFEEVARLPLRQRQVLAARFALGLSQQETAELLGIDRGTVSATTSKAAARLRERLGDRR